MLQHGRARKPPLGRAIVAAFAWSAVLAVGASFAALFTASWIVVGAVIVVGGALFWAVVHRLWRDY